MKDWTWNANVRAFQKGVRRIYPIDVGGFVISESEVWMPGAYATREAAEAAFEWPYGALVKLMKLKNETDGVIRLADFTEENLQRFSASAP